MLIPTESKTTLQPFAVSMAYAPFLLASDVCGAARPSLPSPLCLRLRLCCTHFLLHCSRLLLCRDRPGAMTRAKILIVKSSQHAAIELRQSKTYGNLRAHDLDQYGLDGG